MKDLKWKVLEHINGGDFGREGDFGRDVNERSLAVYAAQEKLREMNNEELLDAISEVFEKDPGRGEGMMTDPDDDLVMLKVAQLSRLREENEKLRRRVERLQTALEDMLFEYGDKYDSEFRLKNAGELDMIAKARAALEQKQ